MDQKWTENWTKKWTEKLIEKINVIAPWPPTWGLWSKYVPSASAMCFNVSLAPVFMVTSCQFTCVASTQVKRDSQSELGSHWTRTRCRSCDDLCAPVALPRRLPCRLRLFRGGAVQPALLQLHQRHRIPPGSNDFFIKVHYGRGKFLHWLPFFRCLGQIWMDCRC